MTNSLPSHGAKLLAHQPVRFVVAGSAVTSTHVITGLSLEKLAAVSPFFSNLVAFILATSVSYVLQKNWTFRSEASNRSALPKFITSVLIALALNQLLVFTLVEQLRLSYSIALVAIVITGPLVSWMFCRFWVFTPSPAASPR
jgi:putative flippase GtrA